MRCQRREQEHKERHGVKAIVDLVETRWLFEVRLQRQQKAGIDFPGASPGDSPEPAKCSSKIRSNRTGVLCIDHPDCCFKNHPCPQYVKVLLVDAWNRSYECAIRSVPFFRRLDFVGYVAPAVVLGTCYRRQPQLFNHNSLLHLKELPYAILQKST